MSFRRVSGVAAVVLAIIMWAACGQVYRPVVIPCTGNSGVPGCPVEPLPTPSNFHAVYALYANAPNGISPTAPNYPGGALQIDVSGDSIIAETPSNDTKFGNNPTHLAILPSHGQVFVASAGSVSGGIDVVSNFTTAPQLGSSSGFGPVNSIALPNQTASIVSISEAAAPSTVVTVTLGSALTTPNGYTIVISGVTIPSCTPPTCNPNAYNGAFAVTSNSGTTITYNASATVTGLPSLSSAQLVGAAATYPPQPVFLASTQNSAVFVANYNSNSVSQISTASNVVSNSVSVGVNPVSMAELPNGQKLYVANQTSSNISTLNTVTLAGNTATGFVSGFTGLTPVWMVARNDSQKVYVVTQGDGQLWTIDTASDSVVCSAPGVCSESVGVGANFIFYDPNLGRLYVTNPQASTTNPTASNLYVFSVTGGANDTPIPLATLTIPGLSATACSSCGPVIPESVTALADGSRFYVAGYQTATTCPDTYVTTSSCLIPEMTIYNASSFALQYPSTPVMTLLAWSPSGTTPGPFAQNQIAVAPSAACGVTVPYTPTTIRFRTFVASSADSSRVYVSMCDAGAIADINTTGNNQNNPQSGEPADTLVTDLPAPFGSGVVQANGEPANQSPIFMLSGQ
jgi:YVTN family beta-propeller protein